MNINWKGDLLNLQARIYKARKAARMTQAQAGEIIGMTERSYRDFEGGKKDIPAASLFQLAAALGIRVFDPEGENRKETSGLEEKRRRMLASTDYPTRCPISAPRGRCAV